MFKYLIIFLISFSLYAEMSVDEIIDKANKASYYQGDDGKASVHMTITDKQGRTRERDFVILRKDKEDGKDQFFYIYFKKPSDVRKMVFMVWKHLDKDDDRWLYLPAMDLVKRIAASDKRTSFVGSDFLYEDVSGRGINEDEHELVSQDEKYYVIKNTPKDKNSVEFSSYTIWIDKTTFLPKKAEYLDKSETKYRTVEALEIETVDNFPTIKKSKVTNHETGGNTILEFNNIKYNIGLKENIFTERYLRRAPKEARK